MSVFSAREDAVAVPSWPPALTRTGLVGPGIDTLLTPARNAAVCLPAVPIRTLPDSPATPALSRSMLLDPVVRAEPALRPSARLPLPVLATSALVPAATLSLPVLLLRNAL